MARLLLVANPAAAGFTGALYREVAATLAAAYELTVVWPTTREQAREIATQAAAGGFELAVAFGGDGVAHHVANGIAGTKTGLGIIPAGTTNVLVRILGLPRRPKEAAGYLAEHPPLRTVPMAHLTSDGLLGTRSDHALFAVGMGYDAEVVEQAEQQPFRKLRLGGVHYARSAGWVLWSRFRRRPPMLGVETEGRRARAVGVLVQVHWPYTYFGHVPLSVTPAPEEGLSALVIERLDLLRLPGLLWRMVRRGDLGSVPGLQVWPDCRKLVVEAEPSSWVQSDGELLGKVRQLEISHVADRLLVTTSPTPARRRGWRVRRSSGGRL
ncbi:MAG: hypothetical protein M3N51_11395, partial [Actinomycetota bacterium]|nr:hypothetical protein [Actinomycetota bacterium]